MIESLQTQPKFEQMASNKSAASNSASKRKQVIAFLLQVSFDIDISNPTISFICLIGTGQSAKGFHLFHGISCETRRILEKDKACHRVVWILPKKRQQNSSLHAIFYNNSQHTNQNNSSSSWHLRCRCERHQGVDTQKSSEYLRIHVDPRTQRWTRIWWMGS